MTTDDFRETEESRHQEAPLTRTNTDREILVRLDERTERIDRQLVLIDSTLRDHDIRLDKHEKKIQRHGTILNAITFGLGSAVAAFVAWIQGLLHI